MVQNSANPIAITICMGSSCFSRGNNRSIGVIQSFLETRQGEPAIEVCGRLCEGQCKLGPNLCVNGRDYHEVDPVMVLGLVNDALVHRREDT
jgi:NADH:ubiquinone oxidoreductase subunit E